MAAPLKNLYRVTDKGPINYGGKTYEKNDVIEMSDAEAAGFGDKVRNNTGMNPTPRVSVPAEDRTTPVPGASSAAVRDDSRPAREESRPVNRDTDNR